MQSNIHQTAKWCNEFMEKEGVDMVICYSILPLLPQPEKCGVNETNLLANSTISGDSICTAQCHPQT
jgi:hypothetical protein